MVGHIFYLTEELVINGECLLTADSVMRLVELPRLTKIGDIQDWRLTEVTRREMFSALELRWKKRMGQSKNIMID